MLFTADVCWGFAVFGVVVCGFVVLGVGVVIGVVVGGVVVCGFVVYGVDFVVVCCYHSNNFKTITEQ